MLRPITTAVAVAVSASCAMLGCNLSASAEGLLDGPAPAPGVTRGVVFTGYDYMKGSNYEFAGVVVALNGDLGKDGFVIRSYGARLDYDLNPGDGRGWQGDVMFGYIFTRGIWAGGVYAGAEYQNYKLSPDDPTSVVRGTDWGYKVTTNLQTSKEIPYYFEVNAAYSGSFSSYWARARTGINYQGMTFGPELAQMGSVGYDARRVGGFLSFKLDNIHDKPIEVTLAAGQHYVLGSGPVSGIAAGDGTYAGVTIAVGF